jgi:hypothetical protein
VEPGTVTFNGQRNNMQGSTYNPIHMDDFDKSKLAFDGQGVSTTVTAGTTSNLDYVLTDDCLITGVELIVNNGNYGDTLSLQVVDTTGFTGYLAGTVLDQFGTNWNVSPISDTQFDIVYPAKIIANLTLRVIYASTGSSNVFIGVNYKLHKCLV